MARAPVKSRPHEPSSQKAAQVCAKELIPMLVVPMTGLEMFGTQIWLVCLNFYRVMRFFCIGVWAIWSLMAYAQMAYIAEPQKVHPAHLSVESSTFSYRAGCYSLCCLG